MLLALKYEAGADLDNEENDFMINNAYEDNTLEELNAACYNCNEKGHYARECSKPSVRDAKYFREQMLLALKYEAGADLDNEENDFMINNAYEDNTLEELNAASDHEQCHHENLETIIHTSADDQIDSDIIFDDLYVDNNKAEKQYTMNIELQKQKALLQQELKTCKEWVKEFEAKPEQPLCYKEAYEELKNKINVEKEQLLNEKEEIHEELLKTHDETLKINQETALYKQAFKERENKYLKDIVYDPHLKTGLGYANLKRLKNATKAQLKIYDGDNLASTKLKVDLPDYEETLEDAEEIRLKMKDKMIQLTCAKLNALYESFVPQTEIPEQTYFFGSMKDSKFLYGSLAEYQ
nr:hypothetical protein [Tanacetum cinerariifolium]